MIFALYLWLISSVGTCFSVATPSFHLMNVDLFVVLYSTVANTAQSFVTAKLLLEGNVGSRCVVLRENVAQQLATLLTLDMRVLFVWEDVDVFAGFVGSPHRDPVPSTLGFAK